MHTIAKPRWSHRLIRFLLAAAQAGNRRVDLNNVSRQRTKSPSLLSRDAAFPPSSASFHLLAPNISLSSFSPETAEEMISASGFLREASCPTEEVLESAPNATTSDDRAGSVRIPLARERRKSKREGARDGEIEREQRASRRAAPTRRIRRDEEEVGKAGGRWERRLDLITPCTSWLTMQPRENHGRSHDRSEVDVWKTRRHIDRDCWAG